MIERKVSPKGKSVRVTFELPADAVQEKAAVVGDFNAWDTEEDVMTFDKKRKAWVKRISFKPGEKVEFRYLIDGQEWRNDEEADDYVETPFFSENGILEL